MKNCAFNLTWRLCRTILPKLPILKQRIFVCPKFKDASDKAKMKLKASVEIVLEVTCSKTFQFMNMRTAWLLSPSFNSIIWEPLTSIACFTERLFWAIVNLRSNVRKEILTWHFLKVFLPELWWHIY